MSNYTQPDFRNPVTPGVTVQVENQGNPLGITTVPKYTQPGGTDKPAPPVPNQLADAMGKSKKTFADGTMSST